MTELPSEDPLVGQQFGREGVFSVKRRLGEGGMGTVYQAWDAKREKPRAIKFLNPDQVRSPEMAERFRREGSRFRGLDHENLVRIHGLGRERGLFYIVTEFVEGVTLQERMHQDPPLTTAESLDIGRQIARGLGALHDRRIVHRDLKPANVMLSGEDPRVKVLDFGIAKFLDDASGLTQTGFWVGTVGYAAPEQIRAFDIDHRADLFGLGVILYRMLTGKRPFDGPSDRAIIEATKRGVVERPSKYVELPRGMDSVLLRLLEKKPAKRPADANEVIADLDAMIEGREPPSVGKSGRFGLGGRR